MRRNADLRPGIRLAALRELTRITRRPALAFLLLGFPVLVFLALALTFRAGVPIGLPVAVVDLDRSALSRQIIQTADAAPEIAVTQRAETLAEARAMVRRGEVYGVLMLPAELERDIRAGRRPEIQIFFNNQYMTPGSVVSRSLQTSLATLTTGIAINSMTARGTGAAEAAEAANPVPVQQSPLFNPGLDYVDFLLASLLPAVLQIFICITVTYQLALERHGPGGLRRLARVGGGLGAGIIGKLLPYTVIFAVLLLAGDAVLIAVFDMPFRGNWLIVSVAGLLMIIGYQAFATIFAMLASTVPMALGFAGILTAPAFGFVGVSFPRMVMNGFAMGWSAVLPLTWYMEIRIDQFLRGTPLSMTLAPFETLCWLTFGLVVAAGLLIGLRGAARPEVAA